MNTSKKSHSQDISTDSPANDGQEQAEAPQKDAKQRRIIKPVWGEAEPDDIWPTYAPDTD